MASKRPRREARAPDRLGDLRDVDAAFADLGEPLSETESEEELEEEQQALRGGGRGRGKAPRHAAPASRATTAEQLSNLLVAAPPLVDLLIEEDAVRCVTLVARDAANLQRALGAGVDLAPIWSALATRVRQKKLSADAVAAAAAAAVAAAYAATGGDVAMQEQGDAGQPSGGGDADAVQAAGGSGPAPAAAPTQRALRARRRGKAAAPPPPPSDLEVVQAAGVEPHLGRWNAARIWQLDARAAAWRKHGDEAGLEAFKRVQQGRTQQRQETSEKRREQRREERQELLALRVAEEGLPASMLDAHFDREYFELAYWLLGYSWTQPLEDLLAPIISRHCVQAAKEERTRRLDESLAAEGLGAFKRDWRYRCYIASGELDGLEVLLGTARRQVAALQARFDRARELDERLEAAGLPLGSETWEMCKWIDLGEGDVEALVAALRARTDRELELAELLAVYGLSYKQHTSVCTDFIHGKLPPETGAQEVVQGLLDGLAADHARAADRLAALLAGLEAERLPPTLLDDYTARAYLRNSSISLTHTVATLRTSAYHSAGLRAPPPGRQWLGEAGSAGVRSRQGGASSVGGAADDGGGAVEGGDEWL
ncbi:hypothetical protein C2E20_1857 [Micractinium conductrix]|uniref:Uncharacterized protein n=1 Tax=Micractinium conductrix TaxID=554055 RepID=A0A2P6VM72_9CHLO|nr:hypothetical protein C2E20_1857 [Micractinium conductrix]|eukprot:PSC75183.1 hypothetical protein C2E20_1857 [Micractinium conductrix]